MWNWQCFVCRTGRRTSTCYLLFSKQLVGAETRYSATETEVALAIVCSVRHFAHWLLGKKFKVVTVHSPLKALLLSRTPAQTCQELGASATVRGGLPGKDNIKLDALSWQEWGYPGWNTARLQPRKGVCGDLPHDEEEKMKKEWRQEKELRSWWYENSCRGHWRPNGCVRPVLKHGPRSATRTRVFGWQTPRRSENRSRPRRN